MRVPFVRQVPLMVPTCARVHLVSKVPTARKTLMSALTAHLVNMEEAVSTVSVGSSVIDDLPCRDISIMHFSCSGWNIQLQVSTRLHRQKMRDEYVSSSSSCTQKLSNVIFFNWGYLLYVEMNVSQCHARMTEPVWTSEEDSAACACQVWTKMNYLSKFFTFMQQTSRKCPGGI